MKKVQIYNWRLSYWPPETEHRVLFGIPVNHPGPFVSNNKMIKSSRIRIVDLKNNKVVTENTEYELMGPEMNLFDFGKALDKMLEVVQA